MALGLLALSRIQVDTPLSYLVLPLTVVGLGLGLAGPARVAVIISVPPPQSIGSAAAINSAAGQSGYALGVVLSSLLVTALADNAFQAQMRLANLPAAVIAQINSVWENVFARAMSGTYTKLPAEASQWVTTQFAPAFTTGLAQTLLVMAGLTAAVAVVIFIAMERGLKGSLMER
jgi:hypothetical protein